MARRTASPARGTSCIECSTSDDGWTSTSSREDRDRYRRRSSSLHASLTFTSLFTLFTLLRAFLHATLHAALHGFIHVQIREEGREEQREEKRENYARSTDLRRRSSPPC